MKNVTCLLLPFCACLWHTAPGAESELVKLRPVPLTAVEVRDAFWAPRQATNQSATLPVNFANLEKSGNIRNFELAGQGATQGFSGPVFMDSDLYKALESAAYSLMTHSNAELSNKLEEIIAKVAKAQQPDGYLNTYYIVKEPGKRWTNLRDNHELYCAGHMFEAAVAHYQATRKRNFLDVATRYADHIDSVFGPGKRMGYPGHPEIELALIKLWRATGEQRYFNLARFFIDSRGSKFFAEEHKTPLDRYDGAYWQDDMPIREHQKIKGHAVRAAYLLSGATDVAAQTGDPALLSTIDRVWRNTTQRNMYLTGGIGPSSHNEGFTVDFDLPNATAYQETCASVALAQWNYRLALLYGDARYADVFERSLYNGALAGIALNGQRFFYVNPLESVGRHHRSEWFGCACCPPNISRTIASIGAYAYALSDDGVWLNLYIQGSVKAEFNGVLVKVKVATEYPWDGKVIVEPEFAKPVEFGLHLRIPGWCNAPGQQAGATVKLNHRAIQNPQMDHGYIVLKRTWKKGDRVELNLPMPVQRMAARPEVKADAGLRAIQRGPMVYCLEACDQNANVSLDNLWLPADAELKPVKKPALLAGVTVIQGTAEVPGEVDTEASAGSLYAFAAQPKPVVITAIPYYAWDNRAPGAMKVWLPVAPPVPPSGGLERRAQISVSFANSNSEPLGLNDGVEPQSSHDGPSARCHWWPHKNTSEWAQYSWRKAHKIAGAKVYWFEDEPNGACRLPSSWELQYLDGGRWKPVVLVGSSEYPVAKDKWCEVAFRAVNTTSLRLALKLQPDWAAGVQEWKVLEADE